MVHRRCRGYFREMNPSNPTTRVIPFGGASSQAPDMDSARTVVLPLCYENNVSYGTGCAHGPIHLLEASENLERLDVETMIDWVNKGIHTLPPFYPSRRPATAVGEMKAMANRVLDQDKFLLSLGGDHAVSIGPMMATADHHPGVGILQVDAHLDLRDMWKGSRYNHACVMRRAVEDMGLSAVQVGIRSFSAGEAFFVEKMGMSPFYAHEIVTADDAWIRHVVDALPEKVYLTIDLDGLDPSVMPGTGTPEPGGLTWYQLVKLIKMVGEKKQVLAADITELSKIEGTQVSEYTAATIATKILVHCL